MPALTTIQLRRGSSSLWAASNSPLAQGELGYDTTIKKFKIGDGTSLWGSLSWANITGADFVGTSGINVSYASTSGTITVSVTGLSSSYLSDFNSAVSGLLPVKSIIAGNNITITPTGDKGFVISSPVNSDTVKDLIGSTITGVSGIKASYDNTGKVETISVTGLTSSYIGDFNTSVSGLVSGVYAPLNSPALTGTPTAPTAAADTNTTQIASTAFVIGQASSSNPLMNGTAAVGTSKKYSREDHVHPTDTTRAALAGAAFTGSVSIPSGTGNFNTLTVGNTAVSLNGHTHTSSNITDFNTAVSGLLGVKSLVQGSGIGIVSVSGNHTVSVTGIPTSLITNFASGVNALIDNAVSASIVGGSGVDIVYSSGTNTLTISSSLTAGSGISLTHNSGNYVISLSDPTIQLAEITDLSANARTFLLTPSSNNLSTLVSDETGSGNLVFSNSPTLVSPNIGVATGTSFNSITGLSSSTPLMDSIAAVGTATTAARADHVHPTDTSRAAVAGTLAQFASTTSSQLAGVISDETGTGSLVFANNPTLSGVTINGNLTVGGSGLVASNINDFNTAVRTNRLDQMSVPTSDVSFNSVKITSLADPVSAQDAATKAYVDAARMGLDVKASVRVATTANITLSGTQTVDGVTVIAGDRVLVKNQNTGSQNGIYTVAAGSWSRASDADSDAEVTTGLFTFVSEGTVNADSGWVLTTNDTITLGTTSLAFAQFSGAGQITAGAGLTKNGNTIDAVGTAGRIVVNADNIDLDTVTLARAVSSLPAGATSAQAVVSSVTTDSYGRVTGIIDSYILNASTQDKGLASFDSGDFSVSSGVVSIKASGVDNSQLANSSVTIGSTSVSLGGSITSVSGLSSVSSTSFVGDLSGTATNANNIEVDLSSSNTNNLVFVNGTDGNLKPSVNNNLRFNASANELLGSSNTTPATTLKYFIIDGGTP